MLLKMSGYDWRQLMSALDEKDSTENQIRRKISDEFRTDYRNPEHIRSIAVLNMFSAEELKTLLRRIDTLCNFTQPGPFTSVILPRATFGWE